MMQCLSGSQLLSPVCTHVVVAQRPACNVTRGAQVRRGAGLVVRAESTASSSTSTAEPTSVEPASEVAVSPIPAGPKSIINEETILSAISGDNIVLEDHYGRLRLNPDASTSEIVKAFQERCEEVKQQLLGESETEELINKLKDSVELLTSEEERRMYDWCLLRKATHTVDYAWPYEADLTQRLEDPTSLVPEKEDDGGNRNVALFFAGWFVLSCALNILIGMK
ncbi:hypothetical protein M758_4G176700 [Ceratodon purpureus]|uniref:Uncharacterized protein n=1 Tax=Ceratodon purpureus TaxID=3225 RepID=A0A8T0IAK4_CERPU|nr:hypothetical protein KC19_4G174600 [Ceratodon purpureus]KAG0619935.1 hypothetical protein M758_4G176700 [Ceratodon purpureus]